MAASCCKPSYQRLKKLPAEAEEEQEQEQEREQEEPNGSAAVACGGRTRRRSRSGWLRLSRKWGGRRRRPGVRVAGLRRKARAVGAAVAKVIKRLKEGRSHFGELFAGNYMFMQVSPSPTLPFAEKTFLHPAVAAAAAAAAARNHHQHGLLAPPATISFHVPKIAS